MVQDTDHEFLLLGTRETLELHGLHHQSRDDRREILFRDAVVHELSLELVDGFEQALRVDLARDCLLYTS